MFNKTKSSYIAFFLAILFSLFSLLGTMARASTRIDTSKITINSNDSPILRGEIWYGYPSWYGSRFNGKRTSNGEKFNKRELTAAHRFLPFNTKVLVTNLKNKKSVVVRINNRGLFIDNRIIDLYEDAAKKIDVRKDGIGYIKLQVMTPFIDSNRDNEGNVIEN